MSTNFLLPLLNKIPAAINKLIKAIQVAIVILLLVIFSSCSTDSSYDKAERTYYLNIEVNVANLSQIVKSIRYIPLETTDTNLIGNIDKLIFRGEKFYILDSHNSKSIFIFDSSGHALNTIYKPGKGPGEYHSLRDFIVDKNTDHILLLDADLRKVIEYDSNGNLVKENFFNFNALLFDRPDSSHYLFSPSNITYDNESNRTLILTDNNLNIIDSFIEIGNRADVNITGYTHFFWYNDSLFFNPVLTYDVYKYSGENITKHFSVDFGKYNINPDLLKNKAGLEKFKVIQQSGCVDGLTNIIENEYYLSFNFIQDRKQYLALINKMNYSIKIISDIKNDIDQMPVFNQWWKMGNKYVAILDAADIFKLNEIYSRYGQSPLPKFAKEIKSEDNPILCVLELKENL